MVCPCEPIYQKIYFKTLPVDTTIAGRNRRFLNLFQMDVGLCWVQESLQASLGMSLLHAIAVSIIKRRSHIRQNEGAIVAT